MAESRARNRSKRTPRPKRAEEYATFIRQIELDTIWLHELSVANHHGPVTPEQATIDISNDARWEAWVNGFQVFQHYQLHLRAEERELAEISATFGLRYACPEPPTEALFELFRDNNLPLNTWPYLRELVSSLVGRMNWVPATLPVFKVVAERAQPPAQKAPPQSRGAASRNRSRDN